MNFTKNWKPEWVGNKIKVFLTNGRYCVGLLVSFSESEVWIRKAGSLHLVMFNPDQIISASIEE
jgi:sRNA-binding regulator protein Hfq